MPKLFEIFIVEQDGLTKNAAIDTLFGYPNLETKTKTDRKLTKKYDADEWAALITPTLVKACQPMTPEQRAEYYDDSDLKTYQWLFDNDWFMPDE